MVAQSLKGAEDFETSEACQTDAFSCSHAGIVHGVQHEHDTYRTNFELRQLTHLYRFNSFMISANTLTWAMALTSAVIFSCPSLSSASVPMVARAWRRRMYMFMYWRCTSWYRIQLVLGCHFDKQESCPLWLDSNFSAFERHCMINRQIVPCGSSVNWILSLMAFASFR